MPRVSSKLYNFIAIRTGIANDLHSCRRSVDPGSWSETPFELPLDVSMNRVRFLETVARDIEL